MQIIYSSNLWKKRTIDALTCCDRNTNASNSWHQSAYLQVLGELAQPGDLADELDAFHHLTAFPALPVYPHFRLARNATFRRKVSIWIAANHIDLFVIFLGSTFPLSIPMSTSTPSPSRS